MNVFLVIIILALLAVTGWQISKIFELSKSPNADGSQIANNKDNQNQGKLMMVFAVFLYLLMFYCFWSFSNVLLPDAASEHGSKFDNLMLISMLLIMFVQIVTQALLHYFAYKYRGTEGRMALFYADNDKLEFIWTIIPVITLAGLIIYGLFTWNDIMSINEDEDPLVIELYAQQFSWTARYAGEDNTLGEANVRFIEGINALGVDAEDSYAQDDKIVREIHLPVNKPVLFKLRSQDVLHSAYFPHFRAQMNVVPGMITQFGFTPTVTTDEMRNNDDIVDKVERINDIRNENGDDSYEFDYFLLCNKICGQAHYNMQMKVIVEPESDYKAWLAEQSTFGEAMSEE